MTEKKQPTKKYRAGNITATVWTNTNKDKEGKEYEYQTINIERNYTEDNNGKTEWKTTSTMRKTDLPNVLLVTLKSMEYLGIKEE